MPALFRPAALALAAVALVSPVAAQTIYKVQQPDGSVLFTDQPPVKGKVLEQREVKPMPAPRGAGGGAGAGAVPGAAGSATGRAPAAPSPYVPPRSNAGLDAAQAEVVAAEQALADARRRLEVGREPQEGELQGLRNGGARPTQGYVDRVAALERSVNEAEARTRRAYEARNGLR